MENTTESNIHLNWTLTFHIQKKNFEEAKIVISQMKWDELISSKEKSENWLSNRTLFRKFKKSYKEKDHLLNAKDFILKKIELISDELLKRGIHSY